VERWATGVRARGHRAACYLAVMRVEDLGTPAALVDLEVVERNASRMSEKASSLGVRLRPHVKTHKTIEAARLQVGGHFGGITVSTLAEAAFFAAGGFRDITYAVPIVPAKLAAAARLSQQLDRISVLLDDPAAADAVEVCAREHGIRFSVFLKVDCGGRRAGVDPERDGIVALAGRLAASPHIDFRGILTHAGQSYRCRGRDEIRAVAAHERDVMVVLAARLRDAGVPVEEVSIGSTPTLAVAEDLARHHRGAARQLRLLRRDPGRDRQLCPGGRRLHRARAGHREIPAAARASGGRRGAGALQDPGPLHVVPECGFGIVLDVRGVPIEHLRVVSLSQEHGVVRSARDLRPGEFPIGSLLRVVPNHSCLAAALFDRYAVLRGADVVGEWHPVRGW